MRKYIFLSLFMVNLLSAQVKIGDNPNLIDSDAILDLESSNKGIILPRVSLDSLNSTNPLSNNKAGMVVYNTVSSGQGNELVSPGVYYNNGTKWVAVDAYSTLSAASPVGEIVISADTMAPSGYFICDGRALSRADYADLFDRIGTTYGTGDGSSTFNIPDYRGYFLRGRDNGVGNDPDAATRSGGDAIGSTQSGATGQATTPLSGIANSAGSHTHTHSDNTVSNVNHISGGGGNSGRSAYNANRTSESSGIHNHTFSAAAGGDDETRPSNISVLYCIKYSTAAYAGGTGSAGTPGTNGSVGNIFRYGLVDPTTEGIDGDFYINTASNELFGPKAGGTWPAGESLNPSTPIPVGSLLTLASDQSPSGYLYCDGSAVSRTTYADLFAEIGEVYGSGDGSTTFNLPDLRAYFLRGQDDGATNDPDASSRTDRGDGTTGDNIGTIQQGENSSHRHESGTVNNYTNINGSLAGPTGDRGNHSGVANNALAISTSTTGGAENRPININVKYHIKY